ncbi:MAG: CsgG/HfaB family protein [Spirochaetota bacterium]|nr:CsgG/HfaB family protein [Spirochaetota bacterium]
MKIKIVIVLILITNTFQCSFNKNINKASIKYNYIQGIKIFTDYLKKSYLSNNTLAKEKLALLTFVNENGNQSRLGDFISNSIQLKIFDPNIFILLERQRIDSILKEYKFNQSGLVNNLDSKKLGKLLGTDLVLVGTISLNKTDTNELYFTINGRIVKLESGEIKAVSLVNILSNEELFEKYNTKINKKIKNLAGTYKIVIKDLKINRKKSNGRNWDAMSGPDVYVTIKTSLSDSIRSKTYNEKYEILDEVISTNIIFGKNDYISITVYDYDEYEIDTIGNLILNESQIIESINNNKEIKTTFGQVNDISIYIERLE